MEVPKANRWLFFKYQYLMLHLRDFPVVTKIGFFAENGLFAPGSSVKNIRTQNKGLFVVSKKGTGQSCFTLLWLRSCPLAK
jgi:hypothetical protein